MLTAPLTPDELQRMDRLFRGLSRHRELTEKINAMAKESGLPLRQIPTYPAGLMGNDLSQILFSHNLLVERLRAEALERLGGVAA